MKFKSLSACIALAGFFSLFTGCSDDPISETQSQPRPFAVLTEEGTAAERLEFGSGLEARKLRITADARWTVTPSKRVSWLHIAPMEGEQDAEVTVTVAANRQSSARSLVLNFACEGEPEIAVTLTQAQAGYALKVSPEQLEVTEIGGDITLTVNANTSWSYRIEQGAWLSEKSKSSDELVLTAQPATAERTATVTVFATEDENISAKVTVTQTKIVADLLDIVFANDGSAKDISPVQLPVTSFPGSALMTYWNDTYERYSAHFNHTVGSSVSTGYYRADFAGNERFRNALADGHSLEVLFRLDAENDGSKEVKMFSAMEKGGTGFLLTKADKGRDITFLPYVGNTWVWTQSGIVPEPGHYYHVVGVWNKQENRTYIYVDGELRGSVATSGEFKQPTSATYYWFGIGADAGNNVGQAAWNGDVTIARAYDKPLTEAEVKTLWAAADRQQGERIEIGGLQYLSGCEVGKGYRYTLYGNGFRAGDRIRLESLSDERKFECTTTVAEKSISIRIPDALTTGSYRMTLLRNDSSAPLGITQLTLSDNPQPLRKPQVVAHRGYHKTGAAENSVAALVEAQKLGVYGSEFDVWITTDDQLVIYHDNSINGKRIENSTYAEIKDFKLANGESLPTLDAYLEQAKSDPKTKIVLEIKSHATTANNERVVDAALAAVARAGLDAQVDYIAFDYAVCQRIARQRSDVLVGYLEADRSPSSIVKDGIRCIDYKYAKLIAQPEWIAEAHANSMAVNVWTVNSETEMLDCIARDVDFITTDHPDTLKEMLAKEFVSRD